MQKIYLDRYFISDGFAAIYLYWWQKRRRGKHDMGKGLLQLGRSVVRFDL